MKETPIMMCGAMVLKTLADEKTQTRRVIKPQPIRYNDKEGSYYWRGGPRLARIGYGAHYVHTDRRSMIKAAIKACPFGGPGDRLWVKEAFGIHKAFDTWYDDGGEIGPGLVCYKANDQCHPVSRWRPSMFMPRYLSRITIEIVDVRVEPLQDITEDDAKAEGVDQRDGCYTSDWTTKGYRDPYKDLWDSLNAERGFPWMDNPWVYVLEFKRITQPETASLGRKQSAACG